MSDEIPQEVLDAWPNCATPDCQHKASANRHSLYCHTCTDRLHADGSAPVGYFIKFRETQERFR